MYSQETIETGERLADLEDSQNGIVLTGAACFFE